MKHLIFMLALVLAMTCASGAAARDMVFGLSPHQSEAELKAQIEQSLLFAAEHLAPGETALFFDASKAALIGSFDAPDRAGYDAPRARLQVNKPVIAALKRFMDGADAVPGRIGASDWPALLRLLRQAYPAGDGAALILLGSPHADDPRARSVSMMGRRVPNDGHVAAQDGQSPYATSGLSGSLEGYDVFIGLVGEDTIVSPSHGYAVERFWTVLVEEHGANVAYFGDDLATLYRMAVGEAPDRPHAAPLEPTDKLEMLTFAPNTNGLSDIYAARPEEVAAQTAVWQNARSITIGATWVENVDVDLYVRPTPTSEVLFYGNATTVEGQLYKDVTISPGLAFETVALREVVDLQNTEIALNFYSGDAPNGVTGELRIAIGDEVWAAPFHIPARGGNQGRGAEFAVVKQVVPNDAWTLIDPLEVLGVE